MQLRWRIAQFFELFWWKFYLAGKGKTDYLQWKKAYWKDFLEKSGLVLPLGATVLDAGCGPAGIFAVLQDFQVDALDPLLDDYEKQLPHFSRVDYPGVRFFNQTLESFEPGMQYDAVFALNAINHVSDLHLCLDRLAGLTKSGGLLIVSVDAHNYTCLQALFRLIPGDILHPHQHTLPGYERMLRERGFTLTRTVLIRKQPIFAYYLLVNELKGNPANVTEPPG